MAQNSQPANNRWPANGHTERSTLLAWNGRLASARMKQRTARVAAPRPSSRDKTKSSASRSVTPNPEGLVDMTLSSTGSPKDRSARKNLIAGSVDGSRSLYSQVEKSQRALINSQMQHRPSTSQKPLAPSRTENTPSECTSTSRALEKHHPDGRWGPGRPYISDWTIPLTKDQHDRIHVALRAKDLEFPKEDENMPWYRLQRLELQLQILADQ